MFHRAFFNTEIHSEAYHGVRSRNSCRVAVNYLEARGPKIYYAVVHKFIFVVLENTLHRLALVTAYHHRTAVDHFGMESIDLNRQYTTGKIVSVACIDRKVIFTPGTPTYILETPHHLSA